MNKTWQQQRKDMVNPLPAGTEMKTLGDIVIDSMKSDGYVPSQASRFSKSFKTNIAMKAVTGVSAVAEDVTTNTPAQLAFNDALTQIGVVTIESSTFSYIRHTIPTNAATTVAEGATKPEATLALERIVSNLSKIAVHTPVTDEQLKADATSQLRDLIDTRLTQMVRMRVIQQILTGNGTAPNLLGLSNTTGILTRAKGTDSIVDAISKSIDDVRTTNGQFDQLVNPNMIFINPATLQPVRLERSNQMYVFGGPTNDGLKTIDGIPVIQTVAVPVGQALIGDFSYARAFTNEETLITVGWVNDQFIRNQQTILAEGYWGVKNEMPSAFIRVTGLTV